MIRPRAGVILYLRARGVRDMATGCLVWTAGSTTGGYGAARLNGRQVLVHRKMFQLTRGRIAKGRVISHSCGRRLCFEPEHLFSRSQRESMAECLSHGRSKAATLTTRDVGLILAAQEKKTAPQEIAKRFGVSVRQVYRIFRGDSWRHLRGVD